MNGEYLRDYELSIWTLQDTFINVLKWSGMEYRDINDEFIRKYPGIGQKGQIQDGSLNIVDDGTEKLEFSVPRFYYDNGKKVINPLWQYFEDNNFTSNMYKIKLIFNKMTEHERVFEFLLTNVDQVHELDSVMYRISGDGLAFQELGKIGYKISLEQSDFEKDYDYWFERSLVDPTLEKPIASLSYWNDKIFKDEYNNWKYLWQYEIQMDWGSFNNYIQDLSGEFKRDSNKVYEEAFVTDWIDQSDGLNYVLEAGRLENYREKSRLVDLKESNIYNLTQQLAETFGVYCRYQYEYDENYHIIGKKVIYYNNYLEDTKGVIDLTYPYTMASATRTIDSSEVTTKMFVRPVDSSDAASNMITIMNLDANKSKEDYLLDFDYLYEIHTITDEQYALVSEYEAMMRFYNINLTRYNTEIDWLTEELNTLEAQQTFYINSIAQDKEQISDLSRTRDSYVDSDYNSSAQNGYIVRDQSNPLTGIVLTTTVNGLSVYSVNLSLQGISKERAIHVYANKTYTTSGYGLIDEAVSFLCEEDDYGYIKKLTNITFAGEKPTTVFITCSYAPVLYYDDAIKVWQTRLAEDERNKAIVDEKIHIYQLRLTGADADYAIVDQAEADYYYIGFGRAGEDIDEFVRSKTNVNYQANIKANEGYARADLAEVEDVHALYAAYDLLLDKKNAEMTRFERLMGPALREGYWQPDTYDDYGNSQQDKIIIEQSSIPNGYSTTTIGYTKETELSNLFIWDQERFDEETDIVYEAGITTTETAHLIINLSGHLDEIKSHLDDLSFVYYDKSIVDMMNALTPGSAGYEEQVKALKLKLMRSCQIGSECEFGYVLTTVNNVRKIVPVLIVTEITNLSVEQLRFILTNNNSNYRPFIGYIHSVVSPEEMSLAHANELYGSQAQATMAGLGYEYDEILEMFYPSNPHVEVKVDPLVSNLTFFNILNASDVLTLNNINKLGDNNTYHGKFFPRLMIHSLEMKTDEDNFMLNINGQPLEMYEDYYILVRSNQISDSLNGYYITIKPEVLFQFGDQDLFIAVSYNISNADMNIYLDALKIMKENARPKVSYNVQLNLMNPQLIQTSYNLLNRIVHINDIELGFDNVQGYISSITLKLDDCSQDAFEIKNYETKFEDLFSTIVAQTESMKKNENAVTTAVNAFSEGQIKPEIIQSSLFRTDLNYRFNQGKLTINEADGIWAVSDEGVVAMRGGGIFTATTMGEDGNWEWNSGILPSGINASLITAGQLDTNKIKIYAGDKVKFQLNADGLFAYKSAFDESSLDLENEDNDNYTEYYSDKFIDPLQYVTFNDNGLFLVAKAGAQVLNPDNNKLDYINNDVNRVEVSWNGLIIRNNTGEKVFYADNSGNLALTGIITAMGGQIAGWTITTNSLTSTNLTLGPTEINFHNGATNYLTCTTAGLTIRGSISGSSITGSTVEGNSIKSGSITGSTVKTNYLYVTQDYSVASNNNTSPYMEYYNGALKVKGGSITGSTVNAGLISGSTVSAGSISGAQISASSPATGTQCLIANNGTISLTSGSAPALTVGTNNTSQIIIDMKCAGTQIGTMTAGEGRFSAEDTQEDGGYTFVTSGTYSVPTILIATTSTTVDVPVINLSPTGGSGGSGLNISDTTSFKHVIESAGIELGGGEVRIIGELVLEGRTLYIKENGSVYAE